MKKRERCDQPDCVEIQVNFPNGESVAVHVHGNDDDLLALFDGAANTIRGRIEARS